MHNNTCLKLRSSKDGQGLEPCGGMILEIVEQHGYQVEVNSVCNRCGQFQSLAPMRIVSVEPVVYQLDTTIFSDVHSIHKH